MLLGGVTMVAANILLLGTYRQLQLASSFRVALKETYLPSFPFHLVGITLAAGAAPLVLAHDVPVVVAVVILVLADFLVRAVAADRARIEEVATLTRERAELLEEALHAEVAEREWIAGQIHDAALQTLAVARQDLVDAEMGVRSATASARKHLDTAVEELRCTLVHVHPGSVVEHGLTATLDAYASQALRRSGARWTIDVQKGVDEHSAALLYPVARELLSNAGRHAHASRVLVRVARIGSTVRLVVEDDGVGFPTGAMAAAGHFGLLTTRRRVAAAGGQMTLGTTIRGGARVEVDLPMPP